MSERKPFWNEDLLAISAGLACLLICLAAMWFGGSLERKPQDDGNEKVSATSPLKGWLAKPGKWQRNPAVTLVGQPELKNESGETIQKSVSPTWMGVIGVFGLLGVVLTLVTRLLPAATSPFSDSQSHSDENASPNKPDSVGRFLIAFTGLFFLAGIAYMMAGQAEVRALNLEYALWALVLGLLISNTIGMPSWLRPAARTELLIKTGLVILGAEVLFGRLLLLGVPGILIAWVVTPIVLVSTFWFGQRILKISSPSLNMVISADMSVCGVSAAVATSAACRAKKEELSLAIGLSLCFTAIMMFTLPLVIRLAGINEVIGGAWMGGTIDATGAVTAAGDLVGETAGEVAISVKLIQNILIGVFSFGVAAYWARTYESSTAAEGTEEGSATPSVGWMEIWRRFPKFVIGFLIASIIFSLLHAFATDGSAIIDGTTKQTSKVLRGWLFCMAFVSIGLETDFRRLFGLIGRGKPLVLYLVGQALNLILTLAMAWFVFQVLFPDSMQQLLAE